jgi:uncharacterized protein (TIGR02246 family)
MADAPATSSVETEIADLVKRLETAWNAGDSAGFAAPFAENADFVNVMGMHARGRAAILAGHEHIFRTIYAGSVNAYALDSMRLLRDGVALAHVRAHLRVPGGPMAGEHDAIFSFVATRGDAGWQIDSFHNTFVRQPPA